MTEGFAESTITTAIWMICFRPLDYPDWIKKYPNNDALDRIARERIAAKKSGVRIVTSDDLEVL